ncbi:MAG: hypothetical protein HBSAPP03_24660 [Phycisphaerae bacterium]|nr:MAG: hypothetical protein HBSAPP03_24660 [Phycisphaerae bacterium]
MHTSDLSGLLLERCEALGVGACVLSAEGRLTATTSRPRSMGPLLRTARALQGLCSIGMTEPGEAEITPGMVLVVMPYENARGERARLAGLAPTPESLGTPEFTAMCRDACIDPRVARADLAGLARHGASSRAMLRAMLEATIRDALAMHDRDEALASFTAQLSESFDTIDLLYSIGRSMHGPFDGPGFVGMVCERLQTTLPFTWAGAFFVNEPWAPARVRGLSIVRGMPPRRADELSRAVLEVMNVHEANSRVMSDVPMLSTPDQPQVIVQSVQCNGRGIGALVLGGKHGPDPFVSSYDTQLLEAAGGFVSAFTDNMALYDAQQALFTGTVGALTAAIDAKDRYTYGHSERVAWLAREVALCAGMTPDQAERVHIAGLVHDVGKIGVPEAVLCKAGRLTEEEFASIKQHPVIGQRILRDIPGLADILPGVLHHHERIDGRGYPHGLRGEEIPLIARIIAVADTFDAMSSNRSYRPAMPRERVLAEIGRSAGTQLDATLAKHVERIDLTGFDRLYAKYLVINAAAA